MIPQLPNLTNVPDVPLWLSITIVAFLLAGSIFTFIGALGLTFFKNFYDRLHMPTLASSIGVICLTIASIIYLSFIEGHIVLRDLLVLLFISITTPISLMMLSRAAAMRDFTQNWSDISDHKFWQLVTDETDAEVEKRLKQEDREEAQQVAEQIRQKTEKTVRKTQKVKLEKIKDD